MSAQIEAKTLLLAIQEIAKEKDVDPKQIAEFLAFSIKKTYAKYFSVENLEVNIDLDAGVLETNLLFEVVDQEMADSDEFDDILQVSINDAQVKKEALKIGDFLRKPFNLSKDFNQPQVQQILQSFKQKIVEITNQKVFNSWKNKVGEIVVAELEREDQKKGSLYVNLEKFDDLVKTMGFVSLKEQNRLEKLEVGRKYPFVIKEVTELTKFWPVILSRTDTKIINYYMTIENPEIEDGLIEIKKIVRVPGVKTKVVVASKQQTLQEPAAICVGQKGLRVKAVSNAIGGEKVEIYNHSDDSIIMISNLFDKRKIKGIKLFYNRDKTIDRVLVVADPQDLPLIIGSRGYNVKLNNQILGFSVDIRDFEDLKDDELDYLRVGSYEFESHFKPKLANVNHTTSFQNHDYSKNMNQEFEDTETEGLNISEMYNHLEENLEDVNLYEDEFGEEVSNALRNEK